MVKLPTKIMSELVKNHPRSIEESLVGDYRNGFLNQVKDYYRSAKQPVDTQLVGLRWFQERNLLKGLLTFFAGDIRLVFDALFRENTLNNNIKGEISMPSYLAKPFPNKDELFSRANEIANVILATEVALSKDNSQDLIEKVKAEFRRYGADRNSKGRKKDQLPERIRSIKRKRTIFDRKAEKYLLRTLLEDQRKVIKTFIAEGNTVLCLLPFSSDAQLPLLVKDKIGKDGKIYITDTTRQTHNVFFEGLLEYLVDYQKLKGQHFERRTKTQKSPHVDLYNKFVPPQLKYSVGSFLATRLRDIEWYKKQFQLDGSYLPHEVYLYWNIITSNLRYLDTLMNLQPNSLDVIVADSVFRFIPESQKQLLLWLAERVLREGGKLLFQDYPQEQAKIEYYGSDLFENGFRRLNTKFLMHRARWMVYQKTPNLDSKEDITETSVITTTISGDNDEAEEGDPDRKETLEEGTKVIIYSSEIQKSKGEKTFYTIEEIAKKADVSVSVVKRQLQEMGIKPTTNLGRSKSSFKGQKQWQRFSNTETDLIIARLKR